MTSAERPGSDRPLPAARADAERAQAFLRVLPYRRMWRTQLLGGIGDRLGLLVLLVLVWTAAGSSGTFGGGYRGLLLAVASVFAVRLAGTVLFGAVLLGPVARLATGSTGAGRWSARTRCGSCCWPSPPSGSPGPAPRR